MTDVLIVEPSEDLAKVLGEAFARRGMSCSVAVSAQEAISTADKASPKLVILELIIPDHNGLEFIHEFRSYPDWLDTPIIVYSQISAEELGMDEEMRQDMGIIRHFYKPTTSLAELVEAAEATFATVSN